jgi:hypothetical protein
VGSAVPSFPGKTDTSFATSPPPVGQCAGIAASRPVDGTVAAIRSGTEARPSLTSTIAARSASRTASGSSSDSVSERLRTSTSTVWTTRLTP